MILRKDVEAALAGAPVTDRSLCGTDRAVVDRSLLGAGAPPSTTVGTAIARF
ncbi:hypothetical protein [Arthrobacter sp. CAU 1506]|uniref:hypothetical protein n=1 Tax=Arthrobacter sp. CAU 1506 TaxID=2560052 RepID=UPI00145C7472|nr:hypothetical protein [Arthrobacter sp. CAU 1506]